MASIGRVGGEFTLLAADAPLQGTRESRQQPLDEAQHASECRPAEARARVAAPGPEPRRGRDLQENEDERAPSHSITSSARARRLGGIVQPSALAVFKLTISSNLLGAWTGSAPASSPFKILAT